MEAEAPAVRVGATPSGLTMPTYPQPPMFFTGRMPFLLPNQQCESTEGVKRFLLGWSPLAFGESQRPLTRQWGTELSRMVAQTRHVTESSYSTCGNLVAMSSATRSSPPRSGDSAAAWFATAYLSGEDTRLYRSWPSYLVVVPLSTTWGSGW